MRSTAHLCAMSLTNPLQLDSSAFDLETDTVLDRPQARLLGTVAINGYYFHAQAIEVDPETGNAIDPSFEEELDAIATLVGARPGQQEINGRTYVISIFPHSH